MAVTGVQRHPPGPGRLVADRGRSSSAAPAVCHDPAIVGVAKKNGAMRRGLDARDERHGSGRLRIPGSPETDRHRAERLDGPERTAVQKLTHRNHHRRSAQRWRCRDLEGHSLDGS
jgi:hypothetical protein